MASDCVVDPSHLDLSGDFDSQLRNVLDGVRLTRNEVDGLSKLFFDLQNKLQWIWRDCQVMPFGSIVTGLGINSSDVDCYVETHMKDECSQAAMVLKARNILRRQPRMFRQLFAITSAKVPIVKMYHIPTGRFCDISFKSPSGVRNSNLIAFLLRMDERALPLTVLIKYWSKVHHLTGTNLLPNYALTMMTIFFMQQKNILPAVSILQMLTKQAIMVDGWNTAFSENYCHNTDNNQNLYELLGEFFQFYSTYNFDEHIISPFTGTSIPRQLFYKAESIPHEYVLYKTKINEKASIKLDTKLCIQDVFEHNRNCAAGVFPKLALRLKLHFELAAKMYVEGEKDDFLKDMLMRKPIIPNLYKKNKPNMPSPGKTNKPTPNNTSPLPKKGPPDAIKTVTEVPSKAGTPANNSLVELSTASRKLIPTPNENPNSNTTPVLPTEDPPKVIKTIVQVPRNLKRPANTRFNSWETLFTASNRAKKKRKK